MGQHSGRSRTVSEGNSPNKEGKVNIKRSVTPSPLSISTTSTNNNATKPIPSPRSVPPSQLVLNSPAKEIHLDNKTQNGKLLTPASPKSPTSSSVSGDGKKSTKDLQHQAENAFKSLTDDSKPVNWVLLGVPHGELELIGTGQGGINELKKKLHEDEVAFGALKVLVVEGTSSLPRYIGITFIGTNVTGLKRGKAAGTKSQVDKIFKGLTITVECETVTQVTPHQIASHLRKAVSTSTYFDFFCEKIHSKDL